MTAVIDSTEADRALKSKHRAMWASGNYPELVVDLISELGPRLVAECDIKPGQRVLDVAAGSGNASIPAALAGASVVASDLTPELLEVGKQEAADRGAQLEWQQADAEALPFDDARFDTVMSCVGVMFAPHHQVTADELVRVCRAGGTIALLNWTPEGFIGQMFATMKPYAPPPPPGAQPPPLWGSEAHVSELLGGSVTDLTARRETLTVSHFGSPQDLLDYFKSHYGPTIACYRFIADDPERVASLDSAIIELAQRFDKGASSTVLEWEYLLVKARRSG